MPGAEVDVLLKMLVDQTVALAVEWKIEWSNRLDSRLKPRRLYVQHMLDSLGFDCLYHTRLRDERKVFKMNGTYDNVTKYSDWTTIALFDTYVYCVQRPVVTDVMRRVWN